MIAAVIAAVLALGINIHTIPNPLELRIYWASPSIESREAQIEREELRAQVWAELEAEGLVLPGDDARIVLLGDLECVVVDANGVETFQDHSWVVTGLSSELITTPGFDHNPAIYPALVIFKHYLCTTCDLEEGRESSRILLRGIQK